MANPGTRILSVLLASAAAAWCAWHFVPGTGIDRGLVRLVSWMSAKPPVAISGNGSHASPWILVRNPEQKPADVSFPVISLGDDPEGIFQSSPPSPLDLAIVLKNLRRLECPRVGISAVLAWEDPDVIALSALDSAVASFDQVATAAPLSRGPTSSPLPPSFRRASVSPGQVRGSSADLPVVNRIPLPGIILGQDNTLSGFTLLENEPEGFPIAARWDDRIVFAFPVIATIVRQGLSVDDIELVPGSHLKIGPSGPIIPIDRYGRLISPPQQATGPETLNAASLADRTEPPAFDSSKFALLRDDQSGAEPATRRFSEAVAGNIGALSSNGADLAGKMLRRAPASSELALLGAACLAIATVGSRPGFSRNFIHIATAGVAVALQLLLAITVSFWFAGIPVAAATLAAFIVTRACFREIRAAAPAGAPAREKGQPALADEPRPAPTQISEPNPVPAQTPPAEPSPEPVPPEQAIDPVKEAAATIQPRKTASRKAAKKTAKKKAAAKKAAKKSGRSKKSPPPNS